MLKLIIDWINVVSLFEKQDKKYIADTRYNRNCYGLAAGFRIRYSAEIYAAVLFGCGAGIFYGF